MTAQDHLTGRMVCVLLLVDNAKHCPFEYPETLPLHFFYFNGLICLWNKNDK